MKKLKLYALAKLNLNLHVFPKKQQSEYHLIKAVNCSLNLHDTLFIENQERKIEVMTDNEKLLNQEENLSFKAALLLKERFGQLHFGARIFIKKEIPIKAGLGGGSSDVAATLKGLAKLWGLRIEEEEMLSLAEDLGMDVAYCLIGGLALVSGFGEKTRRLNLIMPKIPLLIVIPDEEKPSTAWAYENLDYKTIGGRHKEKLAKLIKAIKTKNISKICQCLHNDFDNSMVKSFSIIKQVKKDLKENDALKSLLAGSGLATVGFFLNKAQAVKAKKKLSEEYNSVILSETL